MFTRLRINDRYAIYNDVVEQIFDTRRKSYEANHAYCLYISVILKKSIQTLSYTPFRRGMLLR